MENRSKLTKLYPMVQITKGTWEIDEFDIASIFLLEGMEKALLIDTGMGVGDLRGMVEMITQKPLIVVHSHGHVDHTGNSRQFDEIWLHPADQKMPIPDALERRRYDTERIAQRQKGSIGAPYNMFNLYPYDIEVDLRDPLINAALFWRRNAGVKWRRAGIIWQRSRKEASKQPRYFVKGAEVV